MFMHTQDCDKRGFREQKQLAFEVLRPGYSLFPQDLLAALEKKRNVILIREAQLDPAAPTLPLPPCCL